jgi:hypothetical protein
VLLGVAKRLSGRCRRLGDARQNGVKGFTHMLKGAASAQHAFRLLVQAAGSGRLGG